MPKRKNKGKPHLESAALILTLTAALDREEYAEALKYSKQLMKRHPEDAFYPSVAARCQIELEHPAEAEKLVRSALSRFPKDATLLHQLGVALIELDRPEEAEAFLRDCIAATAKRDIKNRATSYCMLGEALWLQARREEAVAAWRQALKDFPGHELARQYLDEMLNEYGEPKAPSKAFDDLYHFRKIHTDRYFSAHNIGQFRDPEEAKRVLALIEEAWNDYVVPRSADVDTMTAAEKTGFFSGVTIDFTQRPRPHRSPLRLVQPDPDDDLRDIPPAVREVVDLFDRAFPFLPPGVGGFAVLYGLPAIAAVGVPEQRIMQFIEGTGNATASEEEIFRWVADIVLTLLPAKELDDADEHARLVFDAIEIATEKLPGPDATSVVRQIRELVVNGLPSPNELRRRLRDL